MSALLEEYKALRAEIVSTLAAAYGTTEITVAAVGLLVAGSKFAVENGWPLMLIGASVLFYALALIQLRYEHAVWNMSNQIILTTAPTIRTAISKVTGTPLPDLNAVLSWESDGRQHNHPQIGWTFAAEAARYGLPLFAGLSACIAYVAVVKWDSCCQVVLHSLAIIVDIAIFVCCLFMTVMTRKLLRSSQASSQPNTSPPGVAQMDTDVPQNIEKTHL